MFSIESMYNDEELFLHCLASLHSEEEEEAQEGKKGCGTFGEWSGQNIQDCKGLSKLWCLNSGAAT